MRFSNTWLFLIIALIVQACGTSTAPAIAVNPGEYRPGEVVWRELVTPNPKQAAEFYTKLFGWKIDQKSDAKGGYWLISHEGTPIGGIVQMPTSVRNASGEWICSVSVPDVDGLVGRANANGATTLLAPTNFDGRGRSALIRDPQGAPIALLRAKDGDPVRTAASNNGWLWTELWSQNMAGSVQFYEQAFGAATERKRDGQRDYILLKTNAGKEMAGIVASPVANVRSHWVSYVKVADPAAVVSRAKELGAKVLLEPRADVRGGSLGVFLDPTGAPVAVQRYPIK
jgi:predicted enzyme related to lactoylglutathione lyase